jgi:hypothetical protein
MSDDSRRPTTVPTPSESAVMGNHSADFSPWSANETEGVVPTFEEFLEYILSTDLQGALIQTFGPGLPDFLIKYTKTGENIPNYH